LFSSSCTAITALGFRQKVKQIKANVLLLTFLNVFTRESSYCVQRVLAIAILSVCLSHRWISQTRCKLESPHFHRRVPGRLYSFRNRQAFS